MSAPPQAPINVQIVDFLRRTLAEWPAEPSIDDINRLLRMTSRWRQYLVLQVYLERHGPVIWSGPFEGMDYVRSTTEGALLPRLLGTYEYSLHAHLRAFAAEGLECVIDVGCAEGYYAVGLARLMPQVEVHAFDINAEAQAQCRDLAARNGVAGRVTVGGELGPQDFERFAGRRTLVIVDAEGAEVDVLQPALSPALAGMSLIVETHDILRAGALATLRERFSPTHDIVLVDQALPAFEPPDWFAKLNHLDQLLSLWEWRALPTPWLVMRPKAG